MRLNLALQCIQFRFAPLRLTLADTDALLIILMNQPIQIDNHPVEAPGHFPHLIGGAVGLNFPEIPVCHFPHLFGQGPDPVGDSLDIEKIKRKRHRQDHNRYEQKFILQTVGILRHLLR